MHIHILGICGTFMGGVATLAQQLGHHVTGSDIHVYPPMSTQLESQGITPMRGYEPQHLHQTNPDLVIIGNALSRGNPAVEYLLNRNIPYCSGPAWLAEHVLQDRWVLAVAGTHGKTTTASLLTWILETAGKSPGFLIGGIPKNFGHSARLGDSPYFVIEADEYDSAFFDKRSKFMHYRPRTLILNNLEFDHADIFPDLAAIQRQFHHLVRTVPGEGLLILPPQDKHLQEVIQQGCWTPIHYTGTDWQANYTHKIRWNLLGTHNTQNGLAAMAAAHHIGISPEISLAACENFQNVKRRLEIIGKLNGVTIYDDFAHHPTAIHSTLAGLRKHVGNQRIVTVVEAGSYTMRTGVHKDSLAPALKEADYVLFARPQNTHWSIDEVARQCLAPTRICDNTADLVLAIRQITRVGDHLLIMSNTGFDGLYQQLLAPT